MIRDMAEPTMSIADVDAMLTGEGGFFETVPVIVNGVEVTTAKNRTAPARLLQNSANHGGDGSARYYVFDDGTEATFAENIATAASLAEGSPSGTTSVTATAPPSSPPTRPSGSNRSGRSPRSVPSPLP